VIHYLQRAWAAIELERWELAHEEVLRGLADEPNDVRLHILLAEICYRTHDYGDGRAAARNAIALWPESGRAYYWLAANVVADFLEPDRATRAGEIADQAIACDPDDVANYSLRAQIALFAGDPDAAFRWAKRNKLSSLIRKRRLRFARFWS
jgi:cytochrome c-type biogenesis protein CcmH/NrfG